MDFIEPFAILFLILSLSSILLQASFQASHYIGSMQFDNTIMIFEKDCSSYFLNGTSDCDNIGGWERDGSIYIIAGQPYSEIYKACLHEFCHINFVTPPNTNEEQECKEMYNKYNIGNMATCNGLIIKLQMLETTKS